MALFSKAQNRLLKKRVSALETALQEGKNYLKTRMLFKNKVIENKQEEVTKLKKQLDQVLGQDRILMATNAGMRTQIQELTDATAKMAQTINYLSSIPKSETVSDGVDEA